jgi:hypothetical protein
MHFPATAAVPGDSGLTAFRAVTTNLDGSGIHVAQPEASLTTNLLTFEVNPAGVSQPALSYVYTTFTGTTDSFPNALGFESAHADAVGGIFYGFPFGVATNVAGVDNFEADYFFSNYINEPNLPGIGDQVVNQSFTFGPLSAADQEAVDSEYDNYAVQNQILFISGADNPGNSPVVCAPGTDYNCISVGAYANGTYFNSIGPTSDNGRCKPDITAISEATSFPTPLVAGAATVLMQAGLRGDGGTNLGAAADFRTIKAVLLNGAVKPPDWTNSTASPLDARYGSGVLDLLNAYEQLVGGEHTFLSGTQVPIGSPHPPGNPPGQIAELSGWDFNTITSATNFDAINHYYFQPASGGGTRAWTATATLVWNRQLGESNINQLSLFLYDCARSNLVACCTSLVDNVQHIYVPQLSPGRYDLQVWKAGGIAGSNIVSDAETYALAWSFISPRLALTRSGTNLLLEWPIYPDGTVLESATNLPITTWTTNNLPAPSISSGQYCLPINPTNPVQLFRLEH